MSNGGLLSFLVIDLIEPDLTRLFHHNLALAIMAIYQGGLSIC